MKCEADRKHSEFERSHLFSSAMPFGIFGLANRFRAFPTNFSNNLTGEWQNAKDRPLRGRAHLSLSPVPSEMRYTAHK